MNRFETLSQLNDFVLEAENKYAYAIKESYNDEGRRPQQYHFEMVGITKKFWINAVLLRNIFFKTHFKIEPY